MSWSIDFAGQPSDVAMKVLRYADSLTSPSREEYLGAMTPILALVQQNYGETRPIRVIAHGHGGEMHQAEGSPQQYRQCTVHIQAHDPLV